MLDIRFFYLCRITFFLFMPDIRYFIYAGYPAGLPDIMIENSFAQYFNKIQLEAISMSICPSKFPYVCPSLCPSFCNMYDLLLIYCHSSKNLRNYASTCLFRATFIVTYRRLNCWISGQIISVSGI